MFGILSSHGLFNLSRAFIGAILIIYLVNSGIDLSVIALAKSAQLIVSVIFNYPAGVLSDKYGNKITIILACLSEIIYFAFMIHPNNFNVIAGEMFNGLGIALYAGAFEAWLFKFKEESKNKEDSFSLISRSYEVLFFSTILSGVIGAFYSNLSLYFSMIFMFLSLFSFAFTKTPISKVCGTMQPIPPLKNSGNGVVKFFRNFDVNIVIYIVIAGMMQLLYQFWPVFFKGQPLFFSQKQVGVVFALSMISQWIFTNVSRKVGFNKNKKAVLFCFVGLFLSSLLTISSRYLNFNLYVIVIIYCLFISFGTLSVSYFFSVSCNIFSNDKDESSMISLLDASSRCFGALCLGFVSLFNINDAFIIWSAFPIFVLLLSVLLIFKKRHEYGLNS